MKHNIVFMLSILFALVSATCLAQDSTVFKDLCNQGQTHLEAGLYAEARAAYEKALEVEDLTPDQTGRVLVRIGDAFLKEKKIQDGVAALQKARAIKDIANQTRIEANLLFAQAYLAYPWVLDQSRAAFVEVLNLPEATLEQKTAARKGLIKALMGLRKFGDARTVMTELLADADLTPAENLKLQKSIGTTYALEGKYPEARDALTKVLGMEDLSDADRADIQLKIALSYYEAGDYKRAKPELEKILTMPAADARAFRSDGMGNSVASPMRAAKLRLLKMKPGAEREKTITVLFIGSSLTSRGWMPLVVEKLSESAPADRQRIVVGMYARGGTGIEVFWEDGETRDTARGMIASMPWDMVVMETTSLRKAESNLKYAQLFSDFVRGKNMSLLLYESQIKRDDPYPDSHKKYHEDEVALAKTSKTLLAPVVLAQMKYLEVVPNAEIGSFYADWIHPSQKSMYMAAYCIYSAITGYSPVGLSLPNKMSAEEGRAMQEAVWKAVCETNPNLKPID